jgi:hypothetical protein
MSIPLTVPEIFTVDLQEQGHSPRVELTVPDAMPFALLDSKCESFGCDLNGALYEEHQITHKLQADVYRGLDLQA